MLLLSAVILVPSINLINTDCPIILIVYKEYNNGNLFLCFAVRINSDVNSTHYIDKSEVDIGSRIYDSGWTYSSWMKGTDGTYPFQVINQNEPFTFKARFHCVKHGWTAWYNYSTAEIPDSYEKAKPIITALNGQPYAGGLSISATFELSGLAVNPTQVEVNKPVTISVNVKNTGELSGDCTVELKVNGATEDTKKVTLAGGAQTIVSFTVTKAVAGSYDAAVGSLNGSFTVKTPSGIDGFSFEVVFIGLILAVLILVVYRKS